MLKIIKPFTGKTVRDASSGDSNIFLQNVLVEVATENYRQMMHEAIFLTQSMGNDLTGKLDPPLRATERILSGLFGHAISMIAERSRPEVRIDKHDRYQELRDGEEDDPDEESIDQKKRVGRIDYLAWFAKRTYAIELKMSYMNCETNDISKRLGDRWNAVVKQSLTAQTWLRKRNREEPSRYPKPISLALMVVIGKRAVAKVKVQQFDDDIVRYEDAFLESLKKLSPRPQFLALYTFPREFRGLAQRKQGKPVSAGKALDTNVNMFYTPFVAFVARSNVNSST